MTKLSRLAVSDEGFLFDPETGNAFTTNRTGLFILRLLREGGNDESIAQALTEQFEVSAEEAARDIADFRLQLRGSELL